MDLILKSLLLLLWPTEHFVDPGMVLPPMDHLVEEGGAAEYFRFIWPLGSTVEVEEDLICLGNV